MFKYSNAAVAVTANHIDHVRFLKKNKGKKEREELLTACTSQLWKSTESEIRTAVKIIHPLHVDQMLSRRKQSQSNVFLPANQW